MTRKIFDWHPELNIFAKNIRDKHVVDYMFGGNFKPPPPAKIGFVDVTDVADNYFYQYDYDREDTFCAKAPWPITWMEYIITKKMADRSKVLVRHDMGGWRGDIMLGSYIFSYPVEEEDYHRVLKEDLGIQKVAEINKSLATHLPLVQAQATTSGRTRDLQRLSEQHECHTFQIYGTYVADSHMWSHKGYAIRYLDDRGIDIDNAGMELAQTKQDGEYMEFFLEPYEMALGLLNCKNVDTRIVPNSKIQNRKYKRSGSPAIIRRTLVVKPAGVQYDSSGNKTDKKMPWHMCRGHFKTFTDAAPLFGRITGTYWWNAQVRGKRSRGEVHKDYLIEPEEE